MDFFHWVYNDLNLFGVIPPPWGGIVWVFCMLCFIDQVWKCCKKNCCGKSESEQRLLESAAEDARERAADARKRAEDAQKRAEEARRREEATRKRHERQLREAEARAKKAAPEPAPEPALAPKSLSEVLSAAKLSQYEEALREVGCALPEDLAALEEADLCEMGMKKIEVKRLQRVASELRP